MTFGGENEGASAYSTRAAACRSPTPASPKPDVRGGAAAHIATEAVSADGT